MQNSSKINHWRKTVPIVASLCVMTTLMTIILMIISYNGILSSLRLHQSIGIWVFLLIVAVPIAIVPYITVIWTIQKAKMFEHDPDNVLSKNEKKFITFYLRTLDINANFHWWSPLLILVRTPNGRLLEFWLLLNL